MGKAPSRGLTAEALWHWHIKPSSRLDALAAGRLDRSSLGVRSDVLGILLDEESEYLPRLGMPTSFGFRVEHVTVDRHIEHAFRPRCEAQRVDDVLVVGQQIRRRAHGTVGIVSGNAVFDVDNVQVQLPWRRVATLDGRLLLLEEMGFVASASNWFSAWPHRGVAP